VVLAVPLLLIVASCAGAVTDSDEYIALQGTLDETAGLLESAEAESAAARAELEDVRAELAASESALQRRISDVADLEAALMEAEDALDAELNRPWPDAATDLFVAGCTETPNEGLSDEDERAMCECVFTELEESVSFLDLMTFSLIAFSEVDAELDPITGLPEEIDRDFAETLISATTTCILDL
jgi:hypothetical protein